MVRFGTNRQRVRTKPVMECGHRESDPSLRLGKAVSYH